MRRFLKIVALAIVLPLVVFAGLAFWALRHELPPEPQLSGKVERGALQHGGRTRTWIAYVPAKPQAHPALVIVLHGSMGSGEQARHVYGYDFDLLAKEHGFIAVYPQGYDRYWNDCKLNGTARSISRFLARIKGVVCARFPAITVADFLAASRLVHEGVQENRLTYQAPRDAAALRQGAGADSAFSGFCRHYSAANRRPEVFKCLIRCQEDTWNPLLI